MSARSWRLAAFVLGLGAGVAFVATGIASWPILVAAVAPWLVLAARRVGVALAVTGSLLIGLLLFLLSLMATAATGIPMVLGVSGIAVVLGGGGIVLLARLPASSARSVRPVTTLTWIPALSGAVVWVGTALAAFVVPGASRLSWVMMGDSANNVLFAREVMYRGGVAVGAAENPVPLPSAVLGYVMAAGRDGVEPTELLRHDILGFVVTWTLLIALSCLVIGAAGGTIARRAGASPAVVGLVAAGTSLLPLSWYLTAYPLEFGFFNTHLTFIVIFAAVITYFSAREHPAVGVALLAVAGTLLLAIWSPLVLLPLALATVVLVRSRTQLWATRGLPLLALGVGIGQIVAYGLLIVLPGLLRQAGFLAALGGVIGFHKWLIVLIAFAAISCAWLATRGRRKDVLLGTAAVAAASAIGVAALLVVSRSWSYYPLKLAWLCAVVLFVFAVALAASVVARYVTRRGPRAVALALVALLTVAFLMWVPQSGLPYDARNPVERVLTGAFLGPGDQLAEQIFALEDPEQSTMLWHSDDPSEAVINFWLLQLWSDSMTKNPDLRVMAYGAYDHDDVDVLCKAVGWMGGGTRVITADPSLKDAVAAACPNSMAIVVVEPPRTPGAQ